LRLAFHDLTQRTDGVEKGALSVRVTNDGSAQTEIDPFVAARIERSRTAQTLTQANDLFAQGRPQEARAALEHHIAELQSKRTESLAVASASPVLKPRAAALDGDFEGQIAAVNRASNGFAPPPPNGSFGAPTPAARARADKSAVKTNTAQASEFGL
jgi:Ca-activated chloride channel family protein